MFLTDAGRGFRMEAIGLAAARFGKVITPEIAQVLEALHKAGYRHITIDLAGYRTGSTAG